MLLAVKLSQYRETKRFLFGFLVPHLDFSHPVTNDTKVPLRSDNFLFPSFHQYNSYSLKSEDNKEQTLTFISNETHSLYITLCKFSLMGVF